MRTESAGDAAEPSELAARSETVPGRVGCQAAVNEPPAPVVAVATGTQLPLDSSWITTACPAVREAELPPSHNVPRISPALRLVNVMPAPVTVSVVTPEGVSVGVLWPFEPVGSPAPPEDASAVAGAAIAVRTSMQVTRSLAERPTTSLSVDWGWPTGLAVGLAL
jgi:hypothetical protein